MAMGDFVVLTALGVPVPNTPVPYVLSAGEPYQAKVSTLALLARWSELQLAAPWPDRVLVLVTPEAELETWPHFRDQVERIAREQRQVEPVLSALQIPPPISEDALWQEVAIVQQALEGASDLVMDVTHGFRSLPLIYWVAAYHGSTLSASLTIHRVLYAHLQGRRPTDEPVPWVDLAPVVALPEWTYAVQAWERHGRLGPLRDLVIASKSPSDPPQRGRFSTALKELAKDWDAGLSLEAGLRARSALGRRAPRLGIACSRHVPVRGIGCDVPNRLVPGAALPGGGPGPGGGLDWRRLGMDGRRRQNVDRLRPIDRPG